MGIYNRVRIIVLDREIELRSEGLPLLNEKYGTLMDDLGAKYSGFMSHSYLMGRNPAHFYLINEASDEVIFRLLYAVHMEKLPFKIFREYNGADTVELDVPNMVSEISRILQDKISETSASDIDIARCKSNIQILKSLISAP
jgi:hypothetical protein